MKIALISFADLCASNDSRTLNTECTTSGVLDETSDGSSSKRGNRGNNTLADSLHRLVRRLSSNDNHASMTNKGKDDIVGNSSDAIPLSRSTSTTFNAHRACTVEDLICDHSSVPLRGEATAVDSAFLFLVSTHVNAVDEGISSVRIKNGSGPLVSMFANSNTMPRTQAYNEHDLEEALQEVQQFLSQTEPASPSGGAAEIVTNIGLCARSIVDEKTRRREVHVWFEYNVPYNNDKGCVSTADMSRRTTTTTTTGASGSECASPVVSPASSHIVKDRADAVCVVTVRIPLYRELDGRCGVFVVNPYTAAVSDAHFDCATYAIKKLMLLPSPFNEGMEALTLLSRRGAAESLEAGVVPIASATTSLYTHLLKRLLGNNGVCFDMLSDSRKSSEKPTTPMLMHCVSRHTGRSEVFNLSENMRDRVGIWYLS